MPEVSRETTEASAAALASVLFPERDKEIRQYVDLLRDEGVTRGLIGPREGDRIWSRHIVNCAVLAEALTPGQRVADIGSGAGLPGLVLALARPDVHVTLIEPLQRRTTFLIDVVDRLGIDNVEVVRARAEDLHGQRSFDVVTARAVAPLSRLAQLALPLCRPGGVVLAMKGKSAAVELAKAARVLDRLGVRGRQIDTFGVGRVQPPTTVVRLESGTGSEAKGRT